MGSPLHAGRWRAVDKAAAELVDLARSMAAASSRRPRPTSSSTSMRGVFHVAGTPAVTQSRGELARAAASSARHSSSTPASTPRRDVPVRCPRRHRRGRHGDGPGAPRASRRRGRRRPVINPLILEGQIHGGVAQGAAQALLEEVRYDDDGNPITANLADYAMISATELPSFEVVHMETPTPVNPLGAKGIGESGTIGSTPAVQSAVVDAVSHLGIRHIDMPATPERVWQAIRDAS